MLGRSSRRASTESIVIKKNNIKYKKYQHVFKKKTCCDLVKLSAAVMGIEFAYSAETAFVSPILLELGMAHEKMTMVWALSPLFGFFLAPLIGSISDHCRLGLGRRRPFILVLALGLLVGLVFVPCGKDIGILLGETPVSPTVTSPKLPMIAVVVTIFGLILMDFNADVCQSPVRAYLLEVTIPEDHARGLSSFTIMSGIGGFLGYALGAVDWNSLTIGSWIGGNIKTVFLIVTVIFIGCIIVTSTSFREIPLPVLEQDAITSAEKNKMVVPDVVIENGNTLKVDASIVTTTEEVEDVVAIGASETKEPTSFLEYLKSIIWMPNSMKILYLTNLLTWMSHLSYTLYFTDFVGESVFHGDPGAPIGSRNWELYNQGVRFGCLGMAIYSLSCALYSFVLERLIKIFGAKLMFMGGLLVYALGMALLAVLRSPPALLALSLTAGVAYSTQLTIPYVVVANYHTKGTFKKAKPADQETGDKPKQVRGLGTDIAIIGSTVFVAQLILSLGLGWLVKSTGDPATVIWAASVLALVSAVAATQVTYLDL